MYKINKYIFFKLGFLILLNLIQIKCEKVLERQLESNFPCNHDADCKPNSFCTGNTVEYSGFCVCDPGYLIQKNRTDYKCYPEAKAVGDPCVLDIQCQYNLGVLAKCQSHKCQCEDGAHDWQNECYRTARLKESCRSNENCLLRGEKLGRCFEGKCQCNKDSIGASGPGGEYCVPATNLGDQCFNNITCKPRNSHCVKFCKCQNGFSANLDQSACLKIALKLKDPCEEDIQCEGLPNAECRLGRCDCRENFVPNVTLSSCNWLVKTGQACFGPKTCGPHANCVAGVCECLYGFHEVERTCNLSNKIEKTIELLFLTLVCVLLIN